MSYIAYINGKELELQDENQIAYTKQVNDMARLDNRQSNFTHKFLVPFSAVNKIAMEFVYFVGSQSNIPYQKNDFDLIDAETNRHLIYKGWANVRPTAKGYEINVYDGFVDFYRAIENKTLKDVGVAALNHAKSLTNIIASWSNTMPYIYAIADFNGKNTFTTTGGTLVSINTDYQVPSARVSYLWNAVHQFAGMTYSGSYFATADFLNWFMTFPKPVPSIGPNRVLIYAGTCTPRFGTYSRYEGSVLITEDSYLLTLPRENFTTPEASVTNDLQTIPITLGGFVYAHNRINILQAGIYTMDVPLGIQFNWNHRDSSGAFVGAGYGPVELDDSGVFQTHFFTCAVGDTIALVIVQAANNIPTPTFDWSLNKIDGFEANFEDALVDFSATEFVNEVMQRGGLTAFKDKYSNNIEYLTLSEILQSTVPPENDWSSKFQYKDDENYKIGRYAKRNTFKYRYNGQNEKHNDGVITIDDENLADEYNALSSKIYSPEFATKSIAGFFVRVFKIWEKELQEDSTIQYKDLSGRFYFLRYETKTASLVIGSETLNTQQTVTSFALANYSNLRFGDIINKYYSDLASILSKGKLINAFFYLKPKDVEDFTFKNLIFVEQLSSYYLVNRIINYVKNKITKCELIEVDYRKTFASLPNLFPSFLQISNLVVDGCEITFDYSTDAQIGTTITVDCSVNNFGLPVTTPPDPIYGYVGTFVTTGPTGSSAFTLSAGSFYQVYLSAAAELGQVISSTLFFENSATCGLPEIPITSLVITNCVLLSQFGAVFNYELTFTTDAVSPFSTYARIKPVGEAYGSYTYDDNTPTSNPGEYTMLRSFAMGSSLAAAEKVQIKIGTFESNEYTI